MFRTGAPGRNCNSASAKRQHGSQSHFKQQDVRPCHAPYALEDSCIWRRTVESSGVPDASVIRHNQNSTFLFLSFFVSLFPYFFLSFVLPSFLSICYPGYFMAGCNSDTNTLSTKKLLPRNSETVASSNRNLKSNIHLPK